MTGRTLLAASASFATLVGFNAHPAGALPTETHKVLTDAVAVEAAQAAIAACASKNFQVTVTVADRNGVPLVVVRSDGAHPVTLEVTRRHAYSAATAGSGTPIKVGNETIGAIGVGGGIGPGADGGCEHAALEKIQGQLN